MNGTARLRQSVRGRRSYKYLRWIECFNEGRRDGKCILGGDGKEDLHHITILIGTGQITKRPENKKL